MKIEPLAKHIYIELDHVKKVGNLITESKKTVHESGKVIAIGKEVTLPVKKGDIILIKGWAFDVITYDKKEYAFISEESGGICAVIRA